MSLSQALSTSVSGLRTTQTALSLVASNVANAQTPGYVRKTLVQTTTAGGATGTGVRVAAVARELDIYVQRQLRTEAAGGAYANTRADFYSRLQTILGEPGSPTTLETGFNKLTTALQALSTTPEDAAARGAVLSAAQALTQTLNSMSNQIQTLRADAELGLSDAVARANFAMKQIADINKRLASSTVNDAATTNLLDQRDAYIDELSQIMDIKVVQTEGNQVNIFTNSGIQLVGIEASSLSFDAKGMIDPTAQWSEDPAKRSVGTLAVISPTGGTYDLIANKSIRSGQIAAYLEMRDHVLVEAQAQLDGIAAAMARSLSDIKVDSTPAAVGTQSGFDIDTDGLLAGNTIHLTYMDTLTGQQRKVTIVRVDDPSALPLSNDATADPGDQVIGVDFSGGVASVADQLNARFNGKIQFSNPSGDILRVLDDGLANNSDIVSLSATRTADGLSGDGAQLSFFTDAANPYTGAITSVGSQSVGFAGRISVNAALLADPSKLVLYQPGMYSADATRPNFIYDKLINGTMTYAAGTGVGSLSAPFTGTLSGFMRQVISVQGEAAANAASLAEGQQVVVNSLQQRLAEGSSVNVDTEMANLLNLQTAYGANARVMSAVKDMIDTLLRM